MFAFCDVRGGLWCLAVWLLIVFVCVCLFAYCWGWLFIGFVGLVNLHLFVFRVGADDCRFVVVR